MRDVRHRVLIINQRRKCHGLIFSVVLCIIGKVHLVPYGYVKLQLFRHFPDRKQVASVVHVHAAEEARARRRASASASDAIPRRPTRPRRLQSPPKWKPSAVDTAVNNAVNTSQCLHFPSIFCGFPVSSFSVAVVDGALARVGEGVLSHRMILSSLMWKWFTDIMQAGLRLTTSTRSL